MLWCLDDDNSSMRWGRALHAAARARGLASRLFSRAEQVTAPGHVFLRLAQYPPGIGRDKAIAAALHARADLTVIPDARQVGWYENKLAQARDLAAWLPQTRIARTMQEADAAIAALGLPLVSKSSEGSSCCNVRLLRSRSEALAEARAALEGDGVPMRLGGPRADARQRGYVLWQAFLAGNAYMYRVGVCGRLRWMFREGNRPGLPFASGSGLYTPVEAIAGETADVLAAADAFCAATGTKWAGLDLARDPASGEWKLLETTTGWGMVHPRGSAGCMLFRPDGTPSGRRGAQLWDALLDEIAAGVFDG